MYGTENIPRNIRAFDDEEKRVDESVIMVLKRGTTEAIFREFKSEPCRDRISGLLFPPEKQESIRQKAIADLYNAFEKIDRPTLLYREIKMERHERGDSFLF